MDRYPTLVYENAVTNMQPCPQQQFGHLLF